MWACTHFLINYTCWKSFFVLEILWIAPVWRITLQSSSWVWHFLEHIERNMVQVHVLAYSLQPSCRWNITKPRKQPPRNKKKFKPLRVCETSKSRCALCHKVHFVNIIFSACFWNLSYSYTFSRLMLMLAQCYLWAVRWCFAMKCRM